MFLFTCMPKQTEKKPDKRIKKVRMTIWRLKGFVIINVGLSPQNNKLMHSNSYPFIN